MKKIFLVATILLVALQAQAKDHKIVVRANSGHPTGHTEVYDNGSSDTLSVVPSAEATTISVLIKDVEGNVLNEYAVPANVESQFTVTTPTLPDSSLIVIRDDKETVYVNFDIE